MTKISREAMERFVSDRSTEEERAAIEHAIESDAAAQGLYDEVARAHFERLITDRAHRAAPPACNPLPASLEERLRTDMRRLGTARHWSIEWQGHNTPLALRVGGTSLMAEAVSLPSSNQPPTIDDYRKSRLEVRLTGNNPLTYHLHCDELGPGKPQELRAIRLSRFRHAERELLEFAKVRPEHIKITPFTPPITRAETWSGKTPSPPLVLGAHTSATTPGASCDSSPTKPSQQIDAYTRDAFRSLLVKATIAPQRDHDVIVAEFEYLRNDGVTVVCRQAIRLTANPNSPGWSESVRVYLPAPTDCGAKEVTIRIRSLEDRDLFLLTADETNELLAEQASVTMTAHRVEDGYVVTAKSASHLKALSDPSTVWSLQVVDAAQGGNHV